MKSSKVKTDTSQTIHAIQAKMLEKIKPPQGKSKSRRIDPMAVYRYDLERMTRAKKEAVLVDLAWEILRLINDNYLLVASEEFEEYYEDEHEDADDPIESFLAESMIFNKLRLQLVIEEPTGAIICISGHYWCWFPPTESLETGNMIDFVAGGEYAKSFTLLEKVVHLVAELKGIDYLKAILCLQKGNFYSLWECMEKRHGYASESAEGVHTRICIASPGNAHLTPDSIALAREFASYEETYPSIEMSPIITEYMGRTDKLSDTEKEQISKKLAFEILQNVAVFYDEYTEYDEESFNFHIEEYIYNENPGKIQLIKRTNAEAPESWLAFSNFYQCVELDSSGVRPPYHRDGSRDCIDARAAGVILEKLGFLMYELKAYKLIEDFLPLQAGECNSLWNELPQSDDIYRSREFCYGNSPESAIRLIKQIQPYSDQYIELTDLTVVLSKTPPTTVVME